MGYLHWKNGRMECPACPKCGGATMELQDVLWDEDPDGKTRRIYLQCGAGHKTSVGKYRYLGGHSFKRIGD